MNCGGCVMMSSYGGLVPKPQEIAALQAIWKDAACNIPQCLGEKAIVDAKIDFTISNNKVVKGDTAQLQWKITNLGNVDYYNTIWVNDWTDGKNFKYNFVLVKAGQTVQGIIDWNTAASSIGVHKIEGNYITLGTDINKTNNKVIIYPEILDPKIPVPITPPTPEPKWRLEIEYNGTYNLEVNKTELSQWLADIANNIANLTSLKIVEI